MQAKDKMTEMTDRAAENASRALSKLSDETVRVQVSKTEVTSIQRVFPGIGPETIVAGIYLPVTGDINGGALLIFPEDIAYVICDLLSKKKPGTTRKLTELDISALKEVGNILCGSFLTVFSNTLKIKIVEHVPSFSFDMFGAVVDLIIAQFAKKTEEAVVIEVKFLFEHAQIKGYVVLIFGLEEMKLLVEALVNAETVK